MGKGREKGKVWKINEGLDWADRIERLCKKVDGHWLWQGAMANGSPRYDIRSNDVHKPISPRKYMYEYTHPDERVVGWHITTCGIAECVNPEHILAGTKNRDRIANQRQNKLEKNERARHIRQLKSEGLSHSQVARICGVDISTVSRIWNNERRAGV